MRSLAEIKADKAAVSLYAKDGMLWMNQNQLAEFFGTSKQNIGQHIDNMLKERKLEKNSVVKDFFTTASDGEKYSVTFLRIGKRVHSQSVVNLSHCLNH